MNHENTPCKTFLHQHERARDIAVNRFFSVCLTPVDVWPSRLSGRIDDYFRLYSVQYLCNRLLVTNVSGDDNGRHAKILFIFLTEPAIAKDDYFWFHTLYPMLSQV